MAVEKFYYHINDHLGNCRVVVNEQGDVEHAYDYYPFGKVLRTGGGGNKEIFTFTGKELDEEGDLDWYYFGARFYDPEIGRWVTVDPLAEKYPSLSPYHYANNNPLRFIDPRGEEWYEIINEEDEKEWKYYEDTPEMKVWTGEHDKEGNKIMEMRKGLTELLVFGGEKLSWLQESGDVKSWAAVSGILDKEGKTQPNLQWIKGKGPIPEGWYIADPSEVQNWSDLNILEKGAAALRAIGIKAGPWPGGPVAWGYHRVPISPKKVGNRGNFFIHGGSFPGSIGCIDLTRYNNQFFNLYTPHQNPLRLQVRYRR